MLIKIEHELSVEKVRTGIRAHIERHRKFYYVGSLAAVAGITYAITRSTIARGGMGEGLNAHGGLTNTASFIFRNKQTLNVTTVLDRESRGHPGWPVRNLETKKLFFSQREAANAFDIPEGRLSGHIKGLYPDVDGLHFERVNLASAS